MSLDREFRENSEICSRDCDEEERSWILEHFSSISIVDAQVILGFPHAIVGYKVDAESPSEVWLVGKHNGAWHRKRLE